MTQINSITLGSLPLHPRTLPLYPVGRDVEVRIRAVGRKEALSLSLRFFRAFAARTRLTLLQHDWLASGSPASAASIQPLTLCALDGIGCFRIGRNQFATCLMPTWGLCWVLLFCCPLSLAVQRLRARGVPESTSRCPGLAGSMTPSTASTPKPANPVLE